MLYMSEYIFSITLLFRIKGFEMIFESYPQLIVNISIMQALQLQEWLNITSCAISAFSVLYGFSDFLANECLSEFVDHKHSIIDIIVY